MAKILGLDLGTNSIGWAVIDKDEEKPILRKGAHIFSEGVKIEKGVESSKAAERTRYRSARKLKFRRKLRKYETLKVLIDNKMCPLSIEELQKWRQYNNIDTNKIESFKHYPSSKEFLYWLKTDNQGEKSNKADKALRKQGIKNPYYFRDKASKEKLTNKYELGRALYHLAQRRGFLSNRLEQTDETLLEGIKNAINEVLDEIESYTLPQLHVAIQEVFERFIDEDTDDANANKLKRVIEKVLKKSETKDSTKEEVEKILKREVKLGPVAGGIKNLSEEIAAAECNTLGQYFFKLFQNNIQENTDKKNIRKHYTAREDHYLEEFYFICKTQELDNKAINDLEQAIFYQRPLKSQKGLVGKCSFEKSKPRCPVSHPAFEEYRALAYINTIKYRQDEKDEFSFLTKEQRESIWHLFIRKSKSAFNFSDIAKAIHPNFTDSDYEKKHFNYKGIDTVTGCPTIASLKNVFGENWKEELYSRYTNKNQKNGIKSQGEVINDIWHVLFTFDKQEKLKEFAIKKLRCDSKSADKFSAIKLKREYASLSLNAINKILPFLREGLLFSHAAFLANMQEVVGKDIWQNENNRKLIQKEVQNIIENYSSEKKRVSIINELFRSFKQEQDYFRKNYSFNDKEKTQIRESIKNVYGAATFNELQEEQKNEIISSIETTLLTQLIKGEYCKLFQLDEMIKNFLKDNFNPTGEQLDKLYHPSDIEKYKKAQPTEDGKCYLGSPIIASIKNPMAMRTLHQLRKLVNELIEEDIIDSDTHIHIELARELNDANKRRAIQRYQRERQSENELIKEIIVELFKEQKKNLSYEPQEDDLFKVKAWSEQLIEDVDLFKLVKNEKDPVTKYKLWKEQEGICLYTGKQIPLNELFDGTSFDIEHTLPRSLSQDNSMMNKTVADSKFNREIKKNILPTQLTNHSEILARIENWKKKAEDFEKQYNSRRKPKGFEDKIKKDKRIEDKHYYKMHSDYWYGKYKRFEMKEVPQGFKNSQLVDTGIITKYARAYMKSVFPVVHSIKGEVVAEFRKIWGLQPNYSTKERTNHVHHCIDAITIASLTKDKYDELAHSWHEDEKQRTNKAREIRERSKPWETFVQDIKEIENEVFVSHYTPNNIEKQTKKKLRVRGKIDYTFKDYLPDEFKNKKEGKDYYKLVKNGKIIYKLPIYLKGDTVRGSLHQETFYGAIAKDIEGNIINDKDGNIIPNYVLRKELVKLKKEDVKKIVDGKVREIIEEAMNNKTITFNQTGAVVKDIVWMNKEKLIQIKKVRLYSSLKNPLPDFKKHRDLSKYPYKQQYNVNNDANYCLAIYEQQNDNDKIERASILVNLIEAGEYYRLSNKDYRKQYPTIVPEIHPETGYKLKMVLKKGLMVLLYSDKEAANDIWNMFEKEKLTRLYVITGLDDDGIKLFYNQDARKTTEVLEYMNEVITQYNKENNKLDKSGKVKESKLTSPKGGDVIGKYKEFPYIKIKPSGFNALIQGVDFEISTTGNIKRLK